MEIRTSEYRRMGAIVGTVIIVMTSASSSTSLAAGQDGDGQHARPCFMSRSNWNTALDGHQPACPVPTWQQTAVREPRNAGVGERTIVGSPVDQPSRPVDFMP